ncbi:hypothetical protein AVEN_143258-1 [Araneus ventricosus]|uniref:HAT C-terminal dimerisation domain-containing protein n=1 Tax=Araneus ventricosus TaxID=182803 RepID=A0A4Y2AG47_ARAVE|nr:hypothetical protein AVEN_143258-1 [Araneus ventricosus]
MQGVFAFLLELDQWNRENSKLRERSFKDEGNSLPFSKPARPPKHSPNSKTPPVPQSLWAELSGQEDSGQRDPTSAKSADSSIRALDGVINYLKAPANGSLLDVPDMKINNDKLFDEVVLAKDYLQSNWEQWKQTRSVIISSEEKCLRLFGHFKENHIAAPNLIKIVKFAFCLPGTSAPVERVFSLMNNAWTGDRGLMKEFTVKGLMTYKINIGLASECFYIKIRNKKDFLKNVLANEKYM